MNIDPKLIIQWYSEWFDLKDDWQCEHYIAQKAAEYGAQQERERLLAGSDEPVAFQIYKQTPPIRALPDVKINSLPWVYDQDPSSGYVASMWVTPVAYRPTPQPVNQQLLEALKYHMEQTRPIQKSIEAIAEAEKEQFKNVP
jgi:hypothetical protein